MRIHTQRETRCEARYPLKIGVGFTVNTVDWIITNTTSGFTRSGAVNEQFSNTIQFLIGGIPSGTQTFSVTCGITEPVDVTLVCTGALGDSGSVTVDGTTQICASIVALSAAPLLGGPRQPR